MRQTASAAVCLCLAAGGKDQLTSGRQASASGPGLMAPAAARGCVRLMMLFMSGQALLLCRQLFRAGLEIWLERAGFQFLRVLATFGRSPENPAALACSNRADAARLARKHGKVGRSMVGVSGRPDLARQCLREDALSQKTDRTCEGGGLSRT